MPKLEPNPSQLPPPSKRTASVRIASTRSTNIGQPRLRSGGSVVVRDTDEEDEPTTESKPNTTKIPQPLSQPLPPPITRTRKAKETQLRLGVGRPKVVGGAGARAVTKSFSASKNKRVSKSVKISEAAIPEEPDPGSFYVYYLLTLVLSPVTPEHYSTNPPAANPTTSPAATRTAPVVHAPPQNLEKINEYMQNIVNPPII